MDEVADPSHVDRDRLLEWVGGAFDPGELDLAATDKWLGLSSWVPLPVRRA